MCIERGVRLGQRKSLTWPTQRGVSLLELIAFIAIVGAALAGVLSVLNVTVAHSADPMVRKQMLAIAESLLEEVESQPFTFCVPDDPAVTAATAASTADCTPTKIQGFGYPASGVIDRSRFNNVENYCNNAGPSAAFCTPLPLGTAGLGNSTISDLTNLSSSPAGYWATIQLVAEPLGGIAATEVLRIRVTVFNFFSPSESIVLEGYRTRWMPHV